MDWFNDWVWFFRWHWIGLLAVFLALTAGPVIAADRRKRLSRGGYAIRTLGFLLLLIVIEGLSFSWTVNDRVLASWTMSEWAMNGVYVLAALALAALTALPLWSVQRAQAIGPWPMTGAGLLADVALVVLAVSTLLWSVHRVQDIGWSKWLCLLFALPLVNVGLWLILLCVPGRERGGEVTAAAG